MGFTGVKVDIMQMLEYVCEEHDGCIEVVMLYLMELCRVLHVCLHV